MPVPKCSRCGKSSPGRKASLYWFKYNNGFERDAWKTLYDRKCWEVFDDEVWNPLLAGATGTEGTQCVNCDTTDPEKLDVFYCTAFVPAADVARISVTACLNCLPPLLRAVRAGSVPLPDRGGMERPARDPDGW